MKVYKEFRSPNIFMGSGSVSQLKKIFSDQANDIINIYLIDEFFSESKVEKSLFGKESDIVIQVSTKEEPKTNQIDSICADIRSIDKDRIGYVIGFGGGSTLDIAKGVSILLSNPGKTEDYQGWDLVGRTPIKKIGIPTLSGTGAEVSRTAVFTSPTKKQGINSLYSMFDTIIIDPDFLKTVPQDQKFFTAMDSFIHSVEAISGTYINAFARSFAKESIELCKKVFLEGASDEELMVASLMGGFSIVHSEVGVCHALSYGLSFGFGVRHGEANCIIFDKLEEYYPEHFPAFQQMILKNDIVLRENITSGVSDSLLEKMIDVCLTMEKPLENALGQDWRNIMTREKIKELLLRC